MSDHRIRIALVLNGGGERRKVVVDVIAGTSAGGLNGSLLATAISHGSTLDPAGADDERGPWLRQRWVGLRSLEVGKLVPAFGVASTSVLDGIEERVPAISPASRNR
ncbi:MAG: hypothetical protein QOH84_6531 [Kribbellaceae bacterium]|nr:hypothetical protein [Kribbellaceae bacterium]